MRPENNAPANSGQTQIVFRISVTSPFLSSMDLPGHGRSGGSLRRGPDEVQFIDDGGNRKAAPGDRMRAGDRQDCGESRSYDVASLPPACREVAEAPNSGPLFISPEALRMAVDNA